jgi:hypothetical protein
MNLSRVVLLTAGVLAAGCTTMSDPECRSTDWYALGERDALVYGLRPQIEIYAYQCEKYGVKTGEKEYLAGWFDGDRERAVRMLGGGASPP